MSGLALERAVLVHKHCCHNAMTRVSSCCLTAACCCSLHVLSPGPPLFVLHYIIMDVKLLRTSLPVVMTALVLYIAHFFVTPQKVLQQIALNP